MKKIFTLTLVLISFTTIAQKTEYKYISSYLNYDYMRWNGSKKQQLFQDNKVDTISLFREKYSNGKVSGKKIQALYIFNSNGIITTNIIYNKGKPITYKFEYDNNNNITEETKLNNKGKILKKISKSYFSKIQYSKVIVYGNGGKNVKQKIIYKMDGKNLLQTEYFRKPDIPYQTWKYEYTTDNQISKTTLYNKKNKILYTWVHDCKPEGEKYIKKNKDTAMVCKFTKPDTNGCFLKTVISTENTTIVKKVMKFSRDSVLLSYNNYDKHNKLIQSTLFNNKYSNTYESIIYNKKNGSEIWKYKTVYNENNLPVKEDIISYKKNGKPVTKTTEYTYNSKELPEKVTHYSGNNLEWCDYYKYSGFIN